MSNYQFQFYKKQKVKIVIEFLVKDNKYKNNIYEMSFLWRY